MHIEMEEFSDVRFKQRAVIEFLTAEKVPPIEIRRRMQADLSDKTRRTDLKNWCSVGGSVLKCVVIL